MAMRQKFHEMQSARLRLRQWTEADRIPFAAMHADPKVMEFMPGALDAIQCDALIQRNLEHFAQYGFGLWSLEVVGIRPFIGYAGLLRTSFVAPFTPSIEMAWMLARDAWGQGYAVEAANVICQRAFGDLGIEEVVSFTVSANTRSRRVMERLGMAHHEAEDFDHPRLPEDHPLRRHVLYRLTRTRWNDVERLAQAVLTRLA
jgi:RimJ/RimL family protein N-acetyltransferase